MFTFVSHNGTWYVTQTSLTRSSLNYNSKGCTLHENDKWKVHDVDCLGMAAFKFSLRLLGPRQWLYDFRYGYLIKHTHEEILY